MSSVKLRSASELSRAQLAVWYGVMALVFIAPLPMGSNRPWAWFLLAALSFLLFAVGVLSGRSFGHHRKIDRRFVWAVFGLAVYPVIQLIPLPAAIADVMQSAHPFVGLSGWRSLTLDVDQTANMALRQAAALLLALLCINYLSHYRIRLQFMGLLVLVGVLNASYGLLDTYAEGLVPWSPPRQGGVWLGLSGTYVNKNHFAGLMELTLPFAIALVMWARSERKGDTLWLFIALASVGILLAGLIMSGSRGGLVSLMAGGGFAVAVVFASRQLGWRLWTKLLVGCVLLGALIVVLLGAQDIWDLYASKPLNALRPAQWISSLSGMSGYWLTGTGLGTFDYYYPAHKPEWFSYLRFDHAHNDYVEALVTTGVVGAVLFVAVLFFGLKRGIAKAGRGEVLSSYRFASIWAVAAFMLHALVDFNFQIPANFLIFFIILSGVSPLGGGTDRSASFH